ncbi:MAG: adenine deaminase [Bacteroidota bacterium]
MQTIKANYVDLFNRLVFAAEVIIHDHKIVSVTAVDDEVEGYIMPGFIDAHVHIESSLLVPSEFARMAVMHGTVATISDPHEIANVLGMQGIEFMISNGKQVPFHFFFGAPSCVPATVFETAGDVISVKDIEGLLQRKEVLYLAEMMNFPGVIHRNEDVMQKIGIAHALNKPVDGHAPGLRGTELQKYQSAGISTDHECFTLDEALEKLNLGMHVLIREGSAARNFDALIPAIRSHPQQIMFCSDDKHPDSLLLGHINQLAAKAVRSGYDVFDVLQACCINPVKHYELPLGCLRQGEQADFIIVEDLKHFVVKQTWINGECVFEHGHVNITSVETQTPNKFAIQELEVHEFYKEPDQTEQVIVCEDGQLVTGRLLLDKEEIGPLHDVLKIAVVNRYTKAKVAVAYVKNFGLKQGAIASSVAHDSHNIVAVGVTDASICGAVNLVIKHKGGLSAVSDSEQHILPLPVAGLMSNEDAWLVARNYTAIDAFSKDVLGSGLKAPFMSLSFMALLVIPSLKLSDKGLFDGDRFELVRAV